MTGIVWGMKRISVIYGKKVYGGRVGDVEWGGNVFRFVFVVLRYILNGYVL